MKSVESQLADLKAKFPGAVVKGGPENAERLLRTADAPKPKGKREDGYDSQLESDFADELYAMRLAKQVVSWRHHPFTLELSCGSYTPDFLVVRPYEGLPQIIDVKGFKRRYSQLTLYCAAWHFREQYEVFQVLRDKAGRWKWELFKPRENVGAIGSLSDDVA